MSEAPIVPAGQKKAAAFAFVGHVFGLWFLERRLGPVMTVRNRVALAVTLTAMIAGGLGRGIAGVLIGWLIGHFA